MSGSGPEALIWIITGACNLRCPYCYASRYLAEKPLGFREVASVLGDAAGSGVGYVQFTGGEPLLRRDIYDILAVARDLGLETSIFTNMTLVSGEAARRLARAGVGAVYTSLDGPREIYERVKGAGMWQRFLEGVKSVKGEGLWLHVNVPVSRFNYRAAGDAVRLAYSLGADSVSVIPVMPSGRAAETGSYVGVGEFLEALRRVEEAAEELGVVVQVWCAPFVKALGWAKHLSASNCRYWSVMDVTPGGSVVVCDVLGVPVANIVRDGVRGAWEKLQGHPLLREAMRVPGKCRGCPLAAWCRGGCYARALIAYGRLPSPDPLCPLLPSSSRQSR